MRTHDWARPLALAAVAAGLMLTACSRKEPLPADSPKAGEGAAYNPATGQSTQADALPGTATYGDPSRVPPATPQAAPTTGAGAGGITQPPPPTPPNTPADGRVDR
jgi:hypothetical protein